MLGEAPLHISSIAAGVTLSFVDEYSSQKGIMAFERENRTAAFREQNGQMGSGQDKIFATVAEITKFPRSPGLKMLFLASKRPV